MKIKSILFWLGIISLSLIQTSLVKINLLAVVILWLGYKAKWLEIWLVGLILDLISGGRLGINAIIFLLIGGIWGNIINRFNFK